MGEIVLHPTHWLFEQFDRPACPECKREILPVTPVEIEELPSRKLMFRHAECAKKKQNNDPRVGLRVIWHEESPGVITAVEPRRAGGPIVSIRLDDRTEMHGLNVQEWEPEIKA